MLLQSKQSVTPEPLVMPISDTPTPMNMKFQPGKRPEEERLPDAFMAHPPPRQLPPLTHQVSLPDMLYKEKLIENKNLQKETGKQRKKLHGRVTFLFHIYIKDYFINTMRQSVQDNN